MRVNAGGERDAAAGGLSSPGVPQPQAMHGPRGYCGKVLSRPGCRAINPTKSLSENRIAVE